MNTKEALEKIEEINSIVQSSNRNLFSGKMMIAFGLLIFSVPIIGYFTQWLTFGHDFGALQLAYLPIANGFFYWGLAIIISVFFNGRKAPGVVNDPVHPLIRKAFSIVRPVSVSLAGIIIVFSVTGQWKYIYPKIFIILGLLFSTFGKFTIPAMVYIAWSYILAGLLFLYLRSYNIALLDFYFLIFHGLTYVTMGIFLMKKKEKADA